MPARSIHGVIAVAVLSVALTLAGPAPAHSAASVCGVGTPAASYGQRVALSAGHAQVWRLYQAFFLRQPDEAGLDYWMRTRSRGAGLSQIAYVFATSTEFQQRYGRLDQRQFVDLVYRNVLCREPDSGGRAYWTNLLETGALTRWDMVINFAELREYLGRTRTCHSIYPSETAAVSSCSLGALRPLSQATLALDGYQARSVAVPRWGGGQGTFQGVEVDLARGAFETGADRCSVASINANWLVASQKDGPNPAVLGLGVIDGVHVKGSSDRLDRGVLGLRFDATPTNVVEVWPGDTLSVDDTRLSSVVRHTGTASWESWHASAESSPYLQHLAPAEIVPDTDWAWAAAGVPLRIDGQTDEDFMSDYVGDPYTYQTLRHPFVAVDQNTGRLVFGATQTLDVRDLVVWAENNGYEDLIKFDGGASAEFNVGRNAVVAGTSRDIPVWLGIGC